MESLVVLESQNLQNGERSTDFLRKEGRVSVLGKSKQILQKRESAEQMKGASKCCLIFSGCQVRLVGRGNPSLP